MSFLRGIHEIDLVGCTMGRMVNSPGLFSLMARMSDQMPMDKRDWNEPKLSSQPVSEYPLCDSDTWSCFNCG
ncbi:hypothetical protein JTE90_006504 [Oedothorax gibbosus]|uniref:Uncharacterized protein n=1 Tax=Oedothorax gibbosus TaxID=931172 RepID=A0AAV6VMC9_9ARAC|nr:hypothetical protein JTE90_006504 [Oedothorax gibbosus]